MGQPLRLRGISGDVKGRVWESDSLLRVGRLGTLEIALDDSSVSRRHAEVRNVDSTWWVRDLDSTHGTYVIGVRLGNGERQLHSRDIIQFGKVAMMVEIVESTEIVAGPTSDLGGDESGWRSFDAQEMDVCRTSTAAPTTRPRSTCYIAFDPRWLTSNVVDLARAILAEQAFERMPILADALMDAGCDSDVIIHRCQRPDLHFGNCWILNLLLMSGSPTPTPAFDRDRYPERF
jgi:predicted component of type VI protein secretion system